MRSLRLALSMFTVVPVRWSGDVDAVAAGRALRWLPFVGVLVGAASAGVAAAVFAAAHGPAYLAAILAVAVSALLTRGLHLDGLADLADGLGSRADRERALTIMSAGDVGPFGVVTLVLTLLVQVACIDAVLTRHGSWAALVVLAACAATGRMACLDAARRGVPSARDGGFGALVAGSTSMLVRVSWTVVLAAAAFAATGYLQRTGFAAPGGWTFYEPMPRRYADYRPGGEPGFVVARALSGVVAVLGGLAVCRALLVHVVRRLGGVTGDVFGALVEVGTTAGLLVYALWT